MAGEAQLEWEGKEITLRHFSTKTSPFGGFEAAYTATGDPVPGLTAANAGERLTGVGKEAYLRSAFVGQGGAAIGPSRELEARVAALATSGEEDVAYSAVERTLKDWRNRRRLNRSNGLIPQLEEERSQLDAALRETADARRRKGSAEQELERLLAKQKELQSDLEIWARIEKHELNRRYGEAYLEWEQARQAVPEDRPHPVFGTMTGEEAWAFAQKRQKEREAAVEENRRREIQRQKLELERAKRSAVRRRVLWAVLALIAVSVAFCMCDAPVGDDAAVALALMAGFFRMLLPWLVLLAAFWGVGMLVIFMGDLRRRRDSDHVDEFAPVPVPEDADWLAQAAQYRETLAKSQQARAAETAARRRVDDLAALTGGRWSRLTLARDFSAQAGGEGETMPRPALALSTGTEE